MSVLAVKNLTIKVDGTAILGGMNMELAPGEIMGLLGPKGAGKTTLIKLLAGFISPDEGNAGIAGIACSEGLSRLHIPCGVVIESARLYGRMTAMENLVFFSELAGMETKHAKEQASELMHRLGIWKDKDIPAAKLGNSSYKRLRVAVSLVGAPELLLWDDIGADLDDRSICEIYDLLTDLVREQGVSALVTSESGLYMDFCHRYTVMNEGKILVQGTQEDLMKSAGMCLRAQMKTADGQLHLDDDRLTFREEDGLFYKDIDGEEAMEMLVRTAVSAGNRLVGAVVMRPSLHEIYEHLIGREVS